MYSSSSTFSYIAAPSKVTFASSVKTDEELAVEFIKAALNRREVRMKDEAIQAILRTLETNPLVVRYKTGWPEQRDYRDDASR